MPNNSDPAPELKRFPACGGGPGSRTLAKQGGRFPVTSGSSIARQARGTLTTVTLGPQPGEAIGSENVDPVAHRREPEQVLEQLLLLCNRRVDLRLEREEAPFRLPDIEPRAELHAKQFVRHVERGHDRDTLSAHHFAGLADLVHLDV